MFILALFLWGIGYFVITNRFRSTADTWSAIALFLWGAAGISAAFKGTQIWALPVVANSISLIWGPYALLMTAMHYTRIMPRKRSSQHVVEALSTLPIMLIYASVPVIQHFGQLESPSLQLEHSVILAVIMAGYLLGTFALMTVFLARSLHTVIRNEAIGYYILIAPVSLGLYVTLYLLPCFGFRSLWQADLLLLVAEGILYLVLFVRQNALGRHYNTENATRSQANDAIIAGTRVLQHAMKNNMLAARLSLQNAQHRYRSATGPDGVCGNTDLPLGDSDAILSDIDLALDACRHSLLILEMIHIKVHPVVFVMETCDLSGIASQAIKESEAKYAAKQVAASMEVEGNPAVYCDPVHMREAILNLVDNAMDELPGDGSGRLDVRIEGKRRKVTLAVSDNGPGMTPSQMAQIGMPLTTQKTEGTHFGVGLYYVTRTVERHGGKFKLKAAPEGGTTAIIKLPASREP